MPQYESHKVTIKGTNDRDVATALAYLAGFREGTSIMHRSPGDQPESSRTVTVFHRDTVAIDPDMYPATVSPDILVSKLLGDVYHVEFNTKKVDSALVSKIEEEIELAYAQRRVPIRNLFVGLKRRLMPVRS
jgi:hypothetical protein